MTLTIEQVLDAIDKAISELDEDALGHWLQGYIVAVRSGLAADAKPAAKKAAAK